LDAREESRDWPGSIDRLFLPSLISRATVPPGDNLLDMNDSRITSNTITPVNTTVPETMNSSASAVIA